MNDEYTGPERRATGMDNLLAMRESVESLGGEVRKLNRTIEEMNEREAAREKRTRRRLRGMAWVSMGLLVLCLGLGALFGWVKVTADSADRRFDKYTSQAVVNCSIRNQSQDGQRNFIRFFRTLVNPTDTRALEAIDDFLKSIPADLDCSKLKV